MKFLKSSVIFFLILLIVLFKPIFDSYASNVYEKVIEDPKDVQIALDIKEVYVKDEPNKLFFKVYPWDSFDFKKEGTGYVGVSIDIDAKTELSNPFEPFEYLVLLRRDKNKNTIHTFKYLHGATGGAQVQQVKIEVTISYLTEISDYVEFSIKKDDIEIKDLKYVSFNVQTWKIEQYLTVVDLAPDGRIYRYELNVIRPTKPTLEVSPEVLDLGNAPYDSELEGKFIVTNAGISGKLEGTIKPSSGKLKLSADKFSLSFLEKLEVSVSVAGKDFGAREFLEKVFIESNGGSKTINVKFRFLPKPVLDYSPDELDYGEVDKGKKVVLELTIRNKKEGPIKGSLKTDLEFISFSRKSFEGESTKIKVEADTALLEPNEYSGVININSNGGDANVPVKIKVVSAKLVLKPESIDFGDVVIKDLQENPKKSVTISNHGNKVLQGDIIIPVDWVRVNPSSFTIEEKESFEIEVLVDLKLLEAGKTFSCELTINSNGGNAIIPIKIHCLEPPSILSVLGKDFKEIKEISSTLKANESFSFAFIVKNAGGGKLEGEIKLKEENSIFKVSVGKFSIKSGESKEIVINSKGPLKKGEYKDILAITSNGGEATIPINVVVQREKLLIKLYIGKNEAFINGNKVLLDVPPYIKNGTTLVPIRFISEAFGAEVFWDAKIGKGQVKIIFEGKTIILLIDSKVAYVDGKEFTLIQAPEIKSGRTFVPIRFISEAFGASVNWNAELREVNIEL